MHSVDPSETLSKRTTNSLQSKISKYSDRFDNHSCERYSVSFNEQIRRGNLGPNLYNAAKSRNTRSTNLHKTIVPLQSSIISNSIAPPIGTYNIPRIMSPEMRGSELGKQIVSSFKSSGRSHQLMDDADHYLTLGEDIKTSNLGPGSYTFQDTWQPRPWSRHIPSRPSSIASTRPITCSQSNGTSLTSSSSSPLLWSGHTRMKEMMNDRNASSSSSSSSFSPSSNTSYNNNSNSMNTAGPSSYGNSSFSTSQSLSPSPSTPTTNTRPLPPPLSAPLSSSSSSSSLSSLPPPHHPSTSTAHHLSSTSSLSLSLSHSMLRFDPLPPTSSPSSSSSFLSSSVSSSSLLNHQSQQTKDMQSMISLVLRHPPRNNNNNNNTHNTHHTHNIHNIHHHPSLPSSSSENSNSKINLHCSFLPELTNNNNNNNNDNNNNNNNNNNSNQKQTQQTKSSSSSSSLVVVKNGLEKREREEEITSVHSLPDYPTTFYSTQSKGLLNRVPTTSTTTSSSSTS